MSRYVSRGVGLLLVLVLACIVGLSTPREASALGGPNAPFTKLANGTADGTLKTWFKNLLLGRGAAGSSYTSLYGAQTGGQLGMTQSMTRAQMAARVLPRLAPLALRFSMVGAATYIGYRITKHYLDGGASDETFDLWLDHNALGRDRLLNPLSAPGTYTDRLKWHEAGWIHKTGTFCSELGAGTDCFALYLSPALYWPNGPSDPGAGPKFVTRQNTDWNALAYSFVTRWPDYDQCASLPWPGFYDDCYIGWDSYPGHSDGGWGAQLGYLATRTLENLDGEQFMGYTLDVHSVPNLWGSGVPGYGVAIPYDGMGDPASVTIAGQGTLPGAPTGTYTHNVPATAADTDTDRAAVVDVVEATGDVCFKAMVNHLYAPTIWPWPSNCWASPPSEEPAPAQLDLPAPYETGEAFSAYRDRLLDAGFTGSITKVVTGPDNMYPSLPNGAVVEVRTGEDLWETIAWPFPLPQIDSGADLEVWVNPGTFTGATAGSVGTITLPQPYVGETASQYRTRLREAGFLGTIIIDVLDPGDLPALDSGVVWEPSNPVRIAIGSPVTTTVEISAPWPTDSPPVVATDTPIRIDAAPPTLAPRTGTDEPAPGLDYPGGAGACEPWLEADPDFGPLLALDFGDKFPFALFGWVGGVLTQLDADPEAPGWDFHIVIPATGVTDETDLGHFAWDLSAFDGYMSIIRTILTFVLWVGALWYFATAMLGIRAPGNPAEAVDEA